VTLKCRFFTQNPPLAPRPPSPCLHTPKSRNRSIEYVLSRIHCASLTSLDPVLAGKKPLLVKPCHLPQPTRLTPASSLRRHTPCMCAHYIHTHLIYIHTRHQSIPHPPCPPTPVFSSVPVNCSHTHFHHSRPCHPSHACRTSKAATESHTTSYHSSSMPVSALTTHVQQGRNLVSCRHTHFTAAHPMSQRSVPNLRLPLFSCISIDTSPVHHSYPPQP
jgi:hypothetical protein